jgi:hypothetical protein
MNEEEMKPAISRAFAIPAMSHLEQNLEWLKFYNTHNEMFRVKTQVGRGNCPSR